MVRTSHHIVDTMYKDELHDVRSRLGEGKHIITCPCIQAFVKAIRPVVNTWVFMMDTYVIGDVL